MGWKELLVIGGFRFPAAGESIFEVGVDNQEDIIHLQKIASYGNIEIKRDTNNFEFHSEPPFFACWIKMLEECYGGGMENGSIESLSLDMVDVPMLGIIGQLKRMGLATVGCCCGHQNDATRHHRRPYVDFHHLDSALIFIKLLATLGYKASLVRSATVEIIENEDSLYKIGLSLSLFTDKAGLIKEVKHKREVMLESLLRLPGVSGREDRVRAFVIETLMIRGLSCQVDPFGNVLGEKRFGAGPTILLSAHMDIIEEIEENSIILKNGNTWKRNKGILGADDRAGVAMIINILDELSFTGFKGLVKFAFTVQEETGQLGARKIVPEFFNGIDYAISLDRKRNRDIVTHTEGYRYGSDDYGIKLKMRQRYYSLQRHYSLLNVHIK